MKIKERLEYLRKEIINERISVEEILELQSLVSHIEPDDVVLLEWAGVKEVDKNKCPVCHGKGYAVFNSQEVCGVCKGYGVAVWSDEFKKLIEESKIPPPPKAKRAHPTQLRIALESSGFDDFEKRCRHVGAKSASLSELKKQARLWEVHGPNLDIPWLSLDISLPWKAAEMKIAIKSRGYRHYEILVNEYNCVHDNKLVIRTRFAVSAWRYNNHTDFAWNKGKSLLLERLNKKGERTGKVLLYDGFVGFRKEIRKPKSSLRSGVWMMTDTNMYGSIGTTVDFLACVKVKGMTVGKKAYRIWLNENAQKRSI